MIGTTHYGPLIHQPEPCGDYRWNVWCKAGALQVLRADEHETFLEANPEKTFLIFFANNSSARVQAGDELWDLLKQIADRYSVHVYPLLLRASFVPWNGGPEDLSAFDAITIARKP